MESKNRMFCSKSKQKLFLNDKNDFWMSRYQIMIENLEDDIKKEMTPDLELISLIDKILEKNRLNDISEVKKKDLENRVKIHYDHWIKTNIVAKPVKKQLKLETIFDSETKCEQKLVIKKRLVLGEETGEQTDVEKRGETLDNSVIKKEVCGEKDSMEGYEEVSELKIRSNTTIEDMSQYIRMINELDERPDNEWWDRDTTEKITLMDDLNSTNIEVGIFYTTDGIRYMYNRNLNLIGEVREWLDVDDEVSDDYKSHEGVVLHPETVLPILQYEVYECSKVYHDIECKVYCDYKYDKESETLQKTYEIIY